MLRNYKPEDYPLLVQLVRSCAATFTPGAQAFCDLFQEHGLRWPFEDSYVFGRAGESAYNKLVEEHICRALTSQRYYLTWRGHPVGVHGTHHDCFQFVHKEARMTGHIAHNLLDQPEWDIRPITEKDEHLAGSEPTQFLLVVRAFKEGRMALVDSIVFDVVSQTAFDFPEFVERLTEKLPEPRKTAFSLTGIDYIVVNSEAKEKIKLLLGGDIHQLFHYRTYIGCEFKCLKVTASDTDAFGNVMPTSSLGFAVVSLRYTKVTLLGRLFFDGKFHWLDLSASFDGGPEPVHEICTNVPVSGKVVQMFQKLASPLFKEKAGQ